MRRSIVALLAVPLQLGCAHENIPGTRIEDTADTRGILDVMKRYQTAVAAKDPAAVAALVDASFSDSETRFPWSGGVDSASLPKKLAAQFAGVEDVHLEVDVRKIDVQGDEASVVYHYRVRFAVLTPRGKAPRVESDVNRMLLHRAGRDWKIVSGI